MPPWQSTLNSASTKLPLPLCLSTCIMMLTARPWLHRATKIAKSVRESSTASVAQVLRRPGSASRLSFQAQLPASASRLSFQAGGLLHPLQHTREGSTISPSLVPDRGTMLLSPAISYRRTVGSPSSIPPAILSRDLWHCSATTTTERERQTHGIPSDGVPVYWS